VALRCGARSESYTVGADREDAAKKLKKLDEEIRTKLAKITKDPQSVYVTVGHGERSLDEAAKDKERGSAKGLKKLIESTNAKLKKLGIAEGLTKAVPDDAALVVVAGPTEAFLAEEAIALVCEALEGERVKRVVRDVLDEQVHADELRGGLGGLDQVDEELAREEARRVDAIELLEQALKRADVLGLLDHLAGEHLARLLVGDARDELSGDRHRRALTVIGDAQEPCQRAPLIVGPPDRLVPGDPRGLLPAVTPHPVRAWVAFTNAAFAFSWGFTSFGKRSGSRSSKSVASAQLDIDHHLSQPHRVSTVRVRARRAGSPLCGTLRVCGLSSC